MTRRSLLRGVVLAVVLILAIGDASATEVERVRAGGIEAWLVEDHTNPIITMSFAFRGGAATDPEGQSGRARMAVGLLDEGAGELEAGAFHERLEELAVKLSFDADLDSVRGNLQTLSENRDAAFELLGLALSQPRFDADAVERVRGQILAKLKRDREEPGTLAARQWMASAFPDHPYGRPVWGEDESVAALTAENLRAFTNAHLARDRLVVGVVGDVTPEDLAPLLETAFGALPAKAQPTEVAVREPDLRGGLTIVEKAVPQSALVFGQRGLKRSDPDFYAAIVLNHILGGGGFTSRLYREVREERGLAYSVGTSLWPLQNAALLRGRAATANETVAEAIQVLRAEWQRLAETGATPEEVRDAKTYLIGSFPLRFTSSTGIARMLVAIQFHDLGIDYLNRRNGLIDAVTVSDVNRVAASLLDPETLSVVVAGEPLNVEATN